jgi:hypothetical protein
MAGKKNQPIEKIHNSLILKNFFKYQQQFFLQNEEVNVI